MIYSFSMQVQSIQNAGNTIDHKKFQKIKDNFFRKIASRKPSNEIKRDRPENIELPRRRGIGIGIILSFFCNAVRRLYRKKD